ncbi:hypothetical protein ES703_89651 [subsurface metagenome]
MFFRHTVMMAFLVILSHITPCVFGLAQESFGNSPISPQQDWPDGVEALIKSAPRIYSSWVNGNERFYYAGDEETLNNFLKFFATIKIPVHLVIIDEEWNKVKQSHGQMARYDWILSVRSGLYRAHIIKEKGADANEQYPSVSIAAYSDRINFSHLIIPENIKMIWSKDRDPNKAPSGKDAIIAAQQWSKALAAWNEFANPRLEEIRAKEIDPSRQWVEIKSEAMSTWLPIRCILLRLRRREKLIGKKLFKCQIDIIRTAFWPERLFFRQECFCLRVQRRSIYYHVFLS